MALDLENAELEDILREHLRTSELVKTVLPTRIALSEEETVEPDEISWRKARVLAIVSNLDSGEGSVFLFKLNATRKNTQPESDSSELELVLLSAIPLTSALTISMAQSRARSGTIDLRPGKYSPAPRPSFLLTLESGGEKQTFTTESSEHLRVFMTECRRLIKVAENAMSLDFRWLSIYQPRRAIEIPLLFPRPDLRLLQKPAYAKLTPAFAGKPGDEETDIVLIRDDWLREKLFDDRSSYTRNRTIRLRLGTFNVNGKSPSQDLSPWIRPQHRTDVTISPLSLSSTSASDYLSSHKDKNEDAEDDDFGCDPDTDPDIIVLGFQELDLSTEALLYSYTTTREDMWLEAIFAALGEVRGQYTKLASKQLVGMLIICIVKNELVKDMPDVRACSIGTGIMGMMGNKGATALRLTLRSTVLTFVNAHFAAFDEFTERRNADFHDLSRRLLFDTSPPSDPDARSEAPIDVENVFQSDALFWMGDLNYRVDLPDAEVRQLISGDTSLRDCNMRDMLMHDQLSKSRTEGKAFEDFREGEIQYLPTYRFGAGIATDINGYDIKRRPAWTDRILYLPAPHLHIKQMTYAAHREVTMSDHVPVSADFCVRAWNTDESAYMRHVRDLVSRLGDFEESEETPRLKVHSSEVQFVDVWYKRKASQKLVLQNTGKNTCAFRFVSLSEDEPVLPNWLSITPQMGILLPDETKSLLLTAFVDDASAPSLNIGIVQLQHTLILHTERGKDHFITVTGKYHPTCFSNDLATLVRLPGPIRDLDIRKQLLSVDPKANAPREAIRLINWLMTNATDVPDLFIERGVPRLVESIRECLDSGDEFDFEEKQDKYALSLSFADTLLLFFQSLPVSVIPATLHQRCVQTADRDEALEVISTELPSASLNVWISLTAFLHYIVQRAVDGQTEGSKAKILACIFAPILLRDERWASAPVTPLSKRRFLLHFIQ